MIIIKEQIFIGENKFSPIMNEQAVFSITPIENYKISDFIVSSSNKAAFDIIANWPDYIWGGNPYKGALLLVGPKSSGKTFLSHIWQQKGALLALHGKQHIFEDIDKIKDEKNLLHKFNTVHESGNFLLMTATKFPKFELPDLASRINSVNKIDINFPDDELLNMLIFKSFSNLSIKVTPEVISYLVKTLPREFSAIQSAIELINKKTLMEKRKVTIPFVKQLCNEHFVQSKTA